MYKQNDTKLSHLYWNNLELGYLIFRSFSSPHIFPAPLLEGVGHCRALITHGTVLKQ